jgi:hypothetical protein
MESKLKIFKSNQAIDATHLNCYIDIERGIIDLD